MILKKISCKAISMNKKIPALTNWGGGGYPAPVFGGEKCCKIAWFDLTSQGLV